MFTINKRVGFSEIAPDCSIRLTDIINYFQDAVIEQSEELNVGVHSLLDQGLCWVLNSWQVVIDRYPDLSEKVTVGTAPYEFKGFMGLRNFIMKTQEGEILARANSVWSLINIEDTTIARIPEFIMKSYTLGEKIEMDYAPRKIKLPEVTAIEGDPIKVQYHNLDSNNHVNNAMYIAMAEDAIPEGRRAWQMRAEYRASAHLDDIIIPMIYRDEEQEIYTVSLEDKDNNPYTIVEFSRK